MMGKNLDTSTLFDNKAEIQTVIDRFNRENVMADLGAESRIGDQCLSLLRNCSVVEEVEICSAVIALGYINKYAFEELPIIPYALLEFREWCTTDDWSKMKKEDKLDKRRIIFSRPEVADYVNKKSIIQASNVSNSKALEKFIDAFLSWGETEKAREAWRIYNGYPNNLQIGQGTIWKKRKNFQ